MKIIAIGDIHGRNTWKQIVHKESFDKVVFLGDYFDTRDDISPVEQLQNFNEICEFKRTNPEKAVLLIGNHDFHYMPIAVSQGERYSGFQSSHLHTFQHALEHNKEILQVAYKHENYLFSHAGISKTWIHSTLGIINKTAVVDIQAKVDEYVNDVFKYSPKHFLFNGNNPYGDDVTQSPIWIRPQSLNEDALPFTHIVGHTSQNRIGIEPTKLINGGEAFFIDTLGTSREYLIISTGKMLNKVDVAQVSDTTDADSSTKPD